jgi:hypothetical protein
VPTAGRGCSSSRRSARPRALDAAATGAPATLRLTRWCCRPVQPIAFSSCAPEPVGGHAFDGRPPSSFSQVRSLARTSWPVSRILSPGPSRGTGGRPSIWACRCRRALATYPQARTGRPRTPAQRHRGGASWSCSGWGLPSHPGHPGCWWSLTPPFHPYPTLACGAVCSLWHFPADHPGLPLATTLPCGVRTFLGDSSESSRSPGQLVRPIILPPWPPRACAWPRLRWG